MPARAPRLDGRSWALLVALSALWSVSFIFIKVAVVEIAVPTLVLVRVGLAAAVLHGVVWARGSRYPTRPDILIRYGFMGLFNNVLPGLLIVSATPRIGAGAASILNATAPIFALLVAHVATRDEKITPPKLAGIMLGAAGIVVMVGPGVLAGLAGQSLAVGAMLLASFCYGVSAVIGRGFGDIEPTVSATCQLSASTLMLLPITLLADRPWTAQLPGTTALASAIALALLSTALAYVLFFQLIARAGGTNAVLVTLLIPISGVFLAWLLLGEAVTRGEVAGMALIGAGLLVVDGRILARPSRVQPPIMPD